jgi:hypothetical protein
VLADDEESATTSGRNPLISSFPLPMTSALCSFTFPLIDCEPSAALYAFAGEIELN